jgi:hypothetical protein
MMGGAPEKPQLVSVCDLSKTVETALQSARVREIGAEPADSVLVKWELVGRRARDLLEGEKLALAITEELGGTGFAARPAVLGIGKEIICGFFEPPNVPIERNF